MVEAVTMARSNRQKHRQQRERHADALRIVNRFLEHATEAGLKPRVTNWADSGSVYIKFDDYRLRSLRISTHGGKRDRLDETRERYRYKWNLRQDVTRNYTRRDRGVVRFFFGWNEIEQLVIRMAEYLRTIDRDYLRPGQLDLFPKEKTNV